VVKARPGRFYLGKETQLYRRLYGLGIVGIIIEDLAHTGFPTPDRTAHTEALCLLRYSSRLLLLLLLLLLLIIIIIIIAVRNNEKLSVLTPWKRVRKQRCNSTHC
jgi:hypothetical protein